jgi:uncharacterized protein YheU (UPF0270 family)
VAAADFEPSIDESRDPMNSHWNAMRDKGTPVEECKERFDDLVERGVLKEGSDIEATLAQRLHALQDSFAWGHEGFQVYDGSLISLPLKHILGDWVPTAPSRAEAMFATLPFLLQAAGGGAGGW